MSALDEYLKGKEKPADLPHSAISSASEQVGKPAWDRGLVEKPDTGEENPFLNYYTVPDYSKLIKEKGYAGAFESLNRDRNIDYDEEEKRLKKERSLALLGDIAQVGVQVGALFGGARGFSPLNSQVPAYNERLRRLREARRGYELGYADKLFSAAMKDYDTQRAEEQYRQKLENAAKLAAAQNELEWNKFTTTQAAKNAEADREYNLKVEQLEETKRRNKARERIAAQNAAQRANDGEDKIVESVMAGDGRIFTRSSKLSDNEIMQIARSYLSDDELRMFSTPRYDRLGKEAGYGYDWGDAFSYAIKKRRVPAADFENRGFTTTQEERKKQPEGKKTIEGFGGNAQKKKTIEGF